MPWHLSADLKYFAKTTTPHAVIMGRKTWESIPDKYRPFKNRLNIVLTRQNDYELPEGVLRADSLDGALNLADDHKREAFVIGGGRVFTEAIEHGECREIYITQIKKTFDCDTHFPLLPPRFTRIQQGPVQEEKGVFFHFDRYAG